MPLPRFTGSSSRRAFLKSVRNPFVVLCAGLGFAGLAVSGDAAVTYAPGPLLTIDVRQNRHQISPDIYGLSLTNADPALIAFAQDLQLPVLRLGGAQSTRYNWELDATNTGDDDFFFAGNGAASYSAAASVDNFVTSATNAGARTIVTIPMISRINNVPGNALDCSFPQSITPVQKAFRTRTPAIGAPVVAGNGRRNDTPGTPLPITGAVQAHIDSIHTDNTTDHQAAFVQYLINTHGTPLTLFQLDHEPSQWHVKHRDVQTAPIGFNELTTRSIAYATRIKEIDPEAQIIGPSDYGYPVIGGTAGGRIGDNFNTHGLPLAAYYLRAMSQASIAEGVLLLNYFDEHHFPAPATGGQPIAFAPAGNATTQAQRLASTRSLWDPTYTETGAVIRLIPRLRELVSTYFSNVPPDDSPKVALSAYNFGGLESVNGALAQADALGIFGREGLDLATLAAPPGPTQPGAFAFRIFRNYDGAGSAFGETSVRAASRNQAQLSVYAAERSTDGALTVVIVNKTANTVTSNLTLNGFKPGPRARVYRYSAANAGAIVSLGEWLTTPYGVVGSYAANSIYVLEIPNRNLL
ncbi:MAG: glycoside hydrolase family 44 protein [Capsulimonadales bacterium]|nr:glycoside hydrolase family 44 protein [Capsulimonadales bacterium]